MVDVLKKSKMLIAGVVLALFSFGVIAMSPHTSAQDSANQVVCEGIGEAFGGDGCNDPADGSSLDGTIKNVISVLSVIVAVISVFMIITGGLRFVTSGGDSNSVSGARKQIIYALVGLLIVALAQILVRLTISEASDNGGSTGTSTPRTVPTGTTPIPQ